MTSRKSSILKPGKVRVREPLQDLSQLLPYNDEEETTTTDNHKRRVSFARMNKIKEFEAAAECTTLLHTPAYDERFSVSSDSYQSSLCEQSHNKSTFEPSCANKLTNSANTLNCSKQNDENVDIVEIGLFDISRGAPSPYKANAGDSSMDITNMVSPNDFVLDQTGTETCYPLNLIKSYVAQSLLESHDDDKDILESSSMETTEALPYPLTETVLTNYSEPYSADVDTATEEKSLFQFDENPVFSTRRMSRKSEIFFPEKPAPKRLSDEMIDSEEVNTVASKRRSLENDPCDGESFTLIPEINRKSIIPQPLVENQNITSFVIREERSTFITIDKDDHTAEIKEVNNFNVDVTYAKSSPDKNKILSGADKKLQNILQEEIEEKIINENIGKYVSTTPEVIPDLNDTEEEIVLSLDDIPNSRENTIPQSEPEKPIENSPPSTESAVESSPQEIEAPSTIFVLKSDLQDPIDEPKIEQNLSPLEPANQPCLKIDSKSQLTISSIAENSENVPICEAFKSTSEKGTNHFPKDIETTQAVREEMKNKNESNRITKDMEMTRPVCENESSHISKDMEMTKSTREEMKSENESNHIPKDMEMTRPVRENESTHISKDMEMTQSIREEMKSENESNHIPKDMEMTRPVRENESTHISKDMEMTQSIREEMKSENESNHIPKDMEMTQPIREQIKTNENESNHVTKDMEITRVVREEMDEIISLVCSQNEGKSINKNVSLSLDGEAKCSEAGESTCEDYSMLVECDLEDVLGNLKAANITDYDQDSFVHQENDISMKVEEPLSVEIVKNSPEVIVISGSSSGNESTLPNENKMEIDQSNDVPVPGNEDKPDCEKVDTLNVNTKKNQCVPKPINEAARSQYLQKKSNIVDKIMTLIPYKKSDWSIKSMSDDKWVFEAIWERLQLIITLDDDEGSCNAKLRFYPKEGPQYARGNEIGKVAIGPIIRKYKGKLDELCRNVEDVPRLLVLLLPRITFAKNFAQDLASTRSSNLSNRIATFKIASDKKHLLFQIELNMKYAEKLSLSCLTITPVIGEVDKYLIYKTFTEAGCDFDFFSKFVNTLWKKMND